MFDDFKHDEEVKREELLETLREVARNPMPIDRLQFLMRETKIRIHREYAARAASQILRFGKIDSLTESCLEFGRQTMADWGIGSLAQEIEKEAGLAK